MFQEIKIVRTTDPKAKPDPDNLGFGRFSTDHMFIMDYTEGKGWHDPRIVPYAPLKLDPATMVFHYGQAVFEGLKAYKTRNGDIYLFRPQKNIERLNYSNDRVCIPAVDPEFTLHAIKELVKVDADWIPEKEGTSLYIRPFIIATDPVLGVHVSKTYKFIIMLSPVGAYYKEGLNPTKIYVETKYVRAVRGGVGNVKVPGNYAASLKAQKEAEKIGYTQVLWLDGVERKYVEEVGTSNVFFKINGEIVTPELGESILAGITRDSCIQLLKKWNYKVTERKISIDEICEAYNAGTLEEAFATGTAAVISPIGELNYNGMKMIINDAKIGELSKRLYDTITGIQYGKLEDDMNWIVKVD